MCLSPKMPKAPEPPAPAPTPVITSTEPTTVKPTRTKRESLQQASKGTSSLSIPLSTGGASSAMTPSMTNLSIGK
jgi:hypothetical protein